MSSIKRHLYDMQEEPTAEDMQEYELYCLYKTMHERLEAMDMLEFFAPLMEE